MSDWQKREYNRRESKKILVKAGVQFTEHNNGAHLKIGMVDFWPGTGLWRDEEVQGRGVHELLKRIKGAKPCDQTSDGKVFTVDHIFEFARKSGKTNLYEICEAIHKGLYKSGAS